MKFSILDNSYLLADELFNYEGQIFATLREKIATYLNQGKSLNFDDLFKQVSLGLGIENVSTKESLPYVEWFNNLTNFTKLRSHLINPENHEIILHDHQLVQIISTQRSCNISKEYINPMDFDLSLEILAFVNKQSWNYSHPFCSFYLELFNSQFRATLIHHSISSNQKSKLFLRKISKSIFGLENYCSSPEMVFFLKKLVRDKNNFVVSGSTCSGKTSLLMSLVKEIDSNEHLVILEDTHEIQTEHPTTTFLLANEIIEGKTLKDYCAYAMRIRPDRILLGEMRSGEIIPFILSMNTGHKGLISTLHANSAKDCISRMCMLFSLYSQNSKLDPITITNLICQNVEYVIHMENKKIKEIIKIFGSENTNPIYDHIL